VADYNQPSDMGVDKKLFFHLFDLAILNSYVVFFYHVVRIKFHTETSTCPSEEYAGSGWTRIVARETVGRLPTASANIHTLDNSFIKHWPCASKPG
jgi:hypothetical protein